MMQFNTKSIITLITFITICLIGLFLRARIAYTTELWEDESISVYVATQLPIEDILLQQNGYFSQLHPPGYYLLLKAWIKYGFFNDKWIRSLTLIFFVPTALVIYKLAKGFSYKRNEALLTVLFFSVHPLLVSLGYQARMYAAALFFCSLSLFFLFNKYQEINKSIVLSSFFLACSIYLDYLSLWLVLGLFILFLTTLKSQKTFSKKIMKILLITFLLTLPQLILLIRYYLFRGGIFPGSIEVSKLAVSYFVQETSNLFGGSQNNNMLSILLLGFCLLTLLIKSKNTYVNLLKIITISILVLAVGYSIVINPIYLARNLSLVSILWCFFLSNAAKSLSHAMKIPLYSILLIYLTNMCFLSLQAKKSSIFLFENGLQHLAEKIASKKALVVFIPDKNEYKYSSYYFPKAGVSKEIILMVNNLLTFQEKESISAAKYIFLIYDSNCDNDTQCKILFNYISPLCSQINKTCEVISNP